jgi:hypothetical protein
MVNDDEFSPEAFDTATKVWRSNKIHLGNGFFAYKCAYIHINGHQCGKAVYAQSRQPLYTTHENWIPKCVLSHEIATKYCWQHRISGPRKIDTRIIM